MYYHDETYPVEVCKWNQKVEQITFILLSAFIEEIKLGKQGNKTWNF